MAVDVAILESAGAGKALPTLRLYGWEPPCISLGYAQSHKDVDLARLQDRNWHIVRRPTGGRAILHTNELTYAVAGPLDEPRLAGTILESYKRISTALLAAVNLMRISAESRATKPRDPLKSNPVCFEVPAKYEIQVNGKKLIGSAQARRKNGVLQHGTLPLFGKLARITEVLAFDDEESRTDASKRLLNSATTVEEALGHRITWEEAAGHLVTGMQETLQINFEIGELNPEEISRAQYLLQEKYGNSKWTRRV